MKVEFKEEELDNLERELIKLLKEYGDKKIRLSEIIEKRLREVIEDKAKD